MILALATCLVATGGAEAKRPHPKQRRAHVLKAPHKTKRSRPWTKSPRATATPPATTGGATTATAPAIGAAVAIGSTVSSFPEAASTPAAAGTAPIASATPPSPTEATTPAAVPLTVGIDGGYAGWWSEEIELRKALDAPVTRHQWEPLEESVDAQDAFMLEATQLVHTRIHAVLGGDELGDPVAYREWVVAFIRRYGLGGSFWAEHPGIEESRYAITTFELGNEPYFQIPAQSYAESIRPTLEAVKKLGLPAKLIIPTYTNGSDTSWTDTLYRAIPELNQLFWAFAEHPYWYGHSPTAEPSNGDNPLGRIESLRRDMAAHGAAEKPLFITEYGESTASCGADCVDEAEQAEHIQAMLDAVVSHPQWRVEMLIFYQLHDWAQSSTDMQKQFGLLRADGTPKPAYGIVRAAMQRYRG